MPEEFLPHETIHHIKDELDELKEKIKGSASKDVKKAMKELASSINQLLDLFKEAAAGAEQEESTEKELMHRVTSLERELAAIKGTALRPAHAIVPPPPMPEPLKIPKPRPELKKIPPRPFPKPITPTPRPPRPFPKPLTPAPMPSAPKPKPMPEPLKMPPRHERPMPPRMPPRHPRPTPPMRRPLPPIPPGPLPPTGKALPRFEEPIPTIQLEGEPAKPKKPGFFARLFGKKKK